MKTLTHGRNEDCPDVRSGNWAYCRGHEISESKRVIEVMPPVGGRDYRIQDQNDALSQARGMESCIKAIKDNIKRQDNRTALRNTMVMGQALVQLQTYLLNNQR